MTLLVDGWDENSTGPFAINVYPLGDEVCGDGYDNDYDHHYDCADSDCRQHPTCVAIQCPTQTISVPGRTTATTLGRPNATRPSCAPDGTSPDAPEVTFGITVAEDMLVTFDTRGSDFDTIVALQEGCGGPELGCQIGATAPASLTHALGAGHSYVLTVEG